MRTYFFLLSKKNNVCKGLIFFLDKKAMFERDLFFFLIKKPCLQGTVSPDFRGLLNAHDCNGFTVQYKGP